ncbi:Uncharacterised protein [Moraxella lacunata]|uniref:Uncharacterized protein n=1 Tax=Moraxella lacunata TaxID=477 RepID=A0A378TUW4_MORLA|nr:hypothetical protein [Moraxella lacunata]STZ63523.1 Uncharacterised protein [Moraxella lacunata]
MTNLFSIYDHQETLLELSNKTSKLRIYKSVGNNIKVCASLNGSNDDFFIPAEHLDKLLTYKSVHHAYKYAKRFELPNSKELFDAHIDNLIALDKAHKAKNTQSQSNPEDKPQSDEEDGTPIVVMIAKDNNSAKVGFHPPLAGLPVCHPSTSPLLGRGGSFISASALPFRQKSHIFGVGVGDVPALALSSP